MGKFNTEGGTGLSVPAFHIYQCKSPADMGMIRLIVVEEIGKMNNFKSAKVYKYHGKSKKSHFVKLRNFCFKM